MTGKVFEIPKDRQIMMVQVWLVEQDCLLCNTELVLTYTCFSRLAAKAAKYLVPTFARCDLYNEISAKHVVKITKITIITIISRPLKQQNSSDGDAEMVGG